MTKTKLDTLLIIRGLLALSVVVWHIGTVNANTPAWMNIPGRTAVWIFFGISGYVISYGFITQRYVLNKEGIRAFYLNRFLRIYPLFLLVSVVTMLTSYFMNGEILLNFADIPSQLLMLQFNHEYILSGVFWTLGVEVQFYVVAPLLIIFLLDTFHNEWLLDISLYFLFF
jgi:peptidoglycan/LPS O-acetylase OafA/YrhL